MAVIQGVLIQCLLQSQCCSSISGSQVEVVCSKSSSSRVVSQCRAALLRTGPAALVGLVPWRRWLHMPAGAASRAQSHAAAGSPDLCLLPVMRCFPVFAGTSSAMTAVTPRPLSRSRRSSSPSSARPAGENCCTRVGGARGGRGGAWGVTDWFWTHLAGAADISQEQACVLAAVPNSNCRSVCWRMQHCGWLTVVCLCCCLCSFVSDVDMRHKVNTFILKNPPENKLSKEEKR